MDIVFFQRQSKFLGGKVQERWAKLILSEDDWANVEERDEEKTFTMVRDDQFNDLKINDIPVLETDCADIVHSEENDAIEAIENLLCKTNVKPEVILSMDFRTFCEMVKATYNIKPQVIVTKARYMLEYVICGEDSSILLVAYITPEEIS